MIRSGGLGLGDASQLLITGRGRPENSQPRTAALRSAGVLARELRHRLRLLNIQIRPTLIASQILIASTRVQA